MTATLLCLHGWGGSQHSFDELRAALGSTTLEVLTPNLPGFGDEPDPPHPWTIDEYGTWVVDYLRTHRQGTGPLFLLGHSHGGRTALKLVATKQLAVDHLILCAPAINRRHRYLIRRVVGVVLAKAGRTLLSLPGLQRFVPIGRRWLYKLMRVHDYERASPLMQQTLVLVTREDLTPLLPQVHTPTTIFWGEDDRQTPVSDAHLIAAAIPGAALHTYPGVRHGVHRDRAADIAARITTLTSR